MMAKRFAIECSGRRRLAAGQECVQAQAKTFAGYSKRPWVVVAENHGRLSNDDDHGGRNESADEKNATDHSRVYNVNIYNVLSYN